MKKLYPNPLEKHALTGLFLSILLVAQFGAIAQTCPNPVTTTITANPNTYYPATTATLAAGATSIALSAAASSGTFGTPSAIAVGDLVLIIQMQGAQINYTNTDSYGNGIANAPANPTGDAYGYGYLTTGSFVAGNMEYAVANSAVPITGGTLTLLSGITKSYKNSNYTTTSGQYRYQVIKVGTYYNLTLGGNFAVPSWNGKAGGVFAVYVVNDLNMNSMTINAQAAGFRGGAGRALVGGTGSSLDYRTLASNAADGSKAEGLAGTPQYIYIPGTSSPTNNSVEGYPSGSYSQGAPGNAGGGGTDGNAGANDQNSGGGGGANGGIGGKGGKSWSSALNSGGEPGADFAQATPARLVMGGGGGAGTTNNATGTLANGLSSSGAPGGGIVLITTRTISGTGTIIADGGNADNSVGNDASGGGGAGGSVVINAKLGTGNLIVTANGGDGGSNSGASCSGCTPQAHGPGGGGGGGIIYSTGTLNPASSVLGGNPGTTNDASAGLGITYGAIAGVTGILSQSITSSQPAPVPFSCTVLPSSFLYVSAARKNKDISVKWLITNEGQTVEYAVERSTDGSNFTSIGTKAATGEGRYEYIDVYSGRDTILYYRIRKIASTGDYEFSRIVSVNIGVVSEDVSVIPNPFTSSATVKFTSPSRGNITMKLISVSGAVVWQRQIIAREGVNTFRLENIMNVSEGIYLLQLNNGVQVQTAKVMIRH